MIAGWTYQFYPEGRGQLMASALSLTNLTLKSKTILISLFRFILNFQCSIQEWLEGVKVRGGGGGGKKGGGGIY